ncbi:MAG: HAD hydrolase-like protein [Bacillota bacterium]
MTLKVIVFDFDGTLIDSQQMKLEAFYQVFPPDRFHQKIIAGVLDEIPEESRYVILASILNSINDEANLEQQMKRLARDYDHIVVQNAIKCREKPGATGLLRSACKKYHLYLSSNTPEESLHTIVKCRGWLSFFKAIFGYPRRKEDTLKEILRLDQVNPDEIIVVGDGQSDKLSADKTGCNFFMIDDDHALFQLNKQLNL